MMTISQEIMKFSISIMKLLRKSSRTFTNNSVKMCPGAHSGTMIVELVESKMN